MSGFAKTLDSEWTKIRTVRSTFWTVAAAVVVTVGLSVLLSLAFTVSYSKMSAADRASFDPAAYSLSGTNFGMIALGVLGVLIIAGEYANGMIRTSLTAVPRRPLLLAAKTIVLALLALVIGELVAFASFLLSQLFYSSKHLDTTLGAPGVLRAVVGAGLYLMLIALFALGIGTILRHTAGAITTVLGLLFVLPIIGSFLPGQWGDTVSKFLPTSAGSAIMNTHPSDSSLAPWTGLGVFALYCAIVLAAAFALFGKRDA